MIKKVRSYLEIDFVVNNGSNRYYIQSHFLLQTKKKDNIIPWHDESPIV